MKDRSEIGELMKRKLMSEQTPDFEPIKSFLCSYWDTVDRYAPHIQKKGKKIVQKIRNMSRTAQKLQFNIKIHKYFKHFPGFFDSFILDKGTKTWLPYTRCNKGHGNRGFKKIKKTKTKTKDALMCITGCCSLLEWTTSYLCPSLQGGVGERVTICFRNATFRTRSQLISIYSPWFSRLNRNDLCPMTNIYLNDHVALPKSSLLALFFFFGMTTKNVNSS